MHNCRNLDFDIALSFAGEDRQYVDKVASLLQKSGLKIFYDKYEQVDLWGKDLYQHLDDVYQKTSKYAVLFLSKYYAKKLWTSHELKSVQARAFLENEEYILPARFDNTEILGIRKTIGYIDLNEYKPGEFAKLIIRKLKKYKSENVLPTDAKRLKQLIVIEEWEYDQEEIDFICLNIFEKLKLLSKDEKNLIGTILIEGCWHRLPNDVHISMEVLERHTKISKQEILSTLNRLSPFGFNYTIKHQAHGSKKQGNYYKEDMLSLKFSNLNGAIKHDNTILILAKMIEASFFHTHCEECTLKGFINLDFSILKEPYSSKEKIELRRDKFL